MTFNFKRICLGVCLCLSSIGVWGAKAHSIPVQVRQSDGTTIIVILRGDEHINWYTTLDGVLLVQAADNSYYVGKVTKDGRLIATQQLAHEAAWRSNAETNLISKQDKDKFYSYVSKVAEQSENSYNNRPLTRITVDSGCDGVPYFPHTGSPKALVILAEFADTTFTIQNTKQVFTNYLMNEEHFTETAYAQKRNYKGVRGYFKDCSYGQFTPTFDVVGPVKLPKPQTVYGAGRNDRPDLLLEDACSAVDNIVDFSQYDANGDGLVDLVYIIYAGHSANTSGNKGTDIWPKSGTISISKTFDGKSIGRYGVSNELAGRENKKKEKAEINGIGLFCHEFSHTLGLPDIYARQGTAAADQDNQGMEYWDLMDGGTEVQNGRVPSPYLAWEREAMGWMTIDKLTSDQQVTDLKSLENGGKAYKILNKNVANEFIVLQSIQQGGWYQGWTKTQIPKGLLAYRISYPYDKVNIFDFPNNDLGKPRVIVIPADGEVLSAMNSGGDFNKYITNLTDDLYPLGSKNSIDEFTMYDGSKLKCKIINITQNDANKTVSFKFIADVTGIQSTPITNLTISDNRIYTLDGRYVGTDRDALPHGIYIQNKQKFIK
mgnify:FL=1